jgi:hypothetical protein
MTGGTPENSIFSSRMASPFRADANAAERSHGLPNAGELRLTKKAACVTRSRPYVPTLFHILGS